MQNFQYKTMQVHINRDFVGTGIQTNDPLTWTILYWVSALSFFTSLHPSRAQDWGDLAGNQPELSLDYSDCVHPP